MPKSKSYNTYTRSQRPELRQHVADMLGTFETDFYGRMAGAADMLDPTKFDLALYKRHNTETILRISLKRAIDPLIANYWATRDPQLCKEWGLYGAEEGRHDRMFAGDLMKIGMTEDEIYRTRPTFATEVLNGYFYYTLATEGPLAAMLSGFYLEYMATKTQQEWLDSMEPHVGADRTKGARAHIAFDIDDDHTEMVWNMCMRPVKTSEDEARVIEHLTKINALFVSYFVEVYAIAKKAQTESPGASSDDHLHQVMMNAVTVAHA